MQAPRHNAIAAALRAILGVPGTGPHLSRYYLYCPLPKEVLPQLFPPYSSEAPSALTFLTMLYLVGLNRGNLMAPGQPGREALYALLRKLGGLANILEGMERFPGRQQRAAEDLPGAIEIMVDLHSQFKVANHYLAALEAELDEAYHRQVIPVAVLARLPWEVTSAWLVDTQGQPPWYYRTDTPTLHALATLVQTSLGFDERLGAIFWETMGPAELVLALPRDRQMVLLTRLRGERLSDELLAQVFPIPAVVAHVPRERIVTYLQLLLEYLGGAEFPAQAARSQQATPPRQQRISPDAAPAAPRARSASPPRPPAAPQPPPRGDGEEDATVNVDADGIEDAGLDRGPPRR